MSAPDDASQEASKSLLRLGRLHMLHNDQAAGLAQRDRPLILAHMSKPQPARYRTTNWSSYNDALRRRGSLLVWLDRGMEWSASKRGRPGRPETFSDAAIQFCLTIKVLLWLGSE